MCKDPRKCPSSLSLKLKDEKTYTSVALSIGPFFSKKKKKKYRTLEKRKLRVPKREDTFFEKKEV